jgi:tetratricopeptide (TPR) repeat protein
MAMINHSTTFAFALSLFTAANLQAQDTTTIKPVENSEDEPALAIVQDSQTVPVAEEGIDAGEDYSATESVDDATLAREFGLFKQLMQDNVFDEADTVAKRVVELAIRLKGPQSNEFAKALTNLAIVQYQTKQYDAAQQNFESAIETIEDNEDRLNAQLVNPLKGLAATQLESGRPDLASTTFRRAIHVTHVNEGPHNLDQVELLESVAETFLRMGDVDAAKETQDTIYALHIRKYQLDTVELVPALLQRAAWQHRVGLIYDERTTYRRAIRIIERNIDRDALELIEPLILLGKSFFYLDTSGTQNYQSNRLSTGEIYFRRAVRIAQEHPDGNWQITAQATLALGDYYIYQGNVQRAKIVYRAAWDMLSEDESRLDVRHKQLEEIVALRQGSLSKHVDSSDSEPGLQNQDPLLRGSITLRFEISSRGQPAKLELIQAQPAEFEKMLRYTQRELRRRIYRPRFVDGEAVATPDQLLAHQFFYRQADLDAARAAAKETR